jgi:glycosyltransferase involved in cell wall biosynthesis
MKISIITATYNSASTVADTLRSIDSQTYKNIEHIIVDGLSQDKTLEIVADHRESWRTLLSEADKGIYDAMNKGVALATGDVIGILNSDDVYYNEDVLKKISSVFETLPVDALFADLIFVRPGNSKKIVRYYRGANFTLSKFASGWMPPHPTFFVKKECYEKYGLFKTDYEIAADFELLARFLVKNGISYHYLPEIIVKMRTGGISTRGLKSNVILNREIVRACVENGIKTNILKIYSKYFYKCMQLFSRPS